MKISFISALAFCGAAFLVAPAASAGPGYHSGSSYSIGETADCPPGTNRAGDGTCLMSRSSRSYMGSSGYVGSSYASGSTITSYASPMDTADCPPGTSRSGDGTCLMTSGSSVYMGSTSPSYSSTPLHSYRGQSSYVINNSYASTMSDSEADYRYGSGSISETYTDRSSTIVPFTTTSANLSSYRVPGMGANEFLSPTHCPVNVYNPEGVQVLGCYQVSKPAPVRLITPRYHTVRVVRPIVYVHYPVHVPVAVPVCRNQHWHSRYGENWPRSRCGW